MDIELKESLDFAFMEQWAVKHPPYLTGTLDGQQLFTALQPIYSLAHKRIVGHEALLRVKDKNLGLISPARFFDRKRSDPEIVRLDRLCRSIHIHNYQIINDPVNWLFLNVSPATISNGKAYGSFFSDLLSARGFPAHRIVIEVVEHPIEDKALIMDTIGYYKDLGCLIALDDFGAGHSNFDRIWTLQPDIVKLDRSFLPHTEANPEISTLLPGIVTLLHQAGSLVLMEGVETRAQALMAIESDVDFVQGFFFEKPFTDLHTPRQGFKGFSDLMSRHKTVAGKIEKKFRKEFRQFSTLFAMAVKKFKDGFSMGNACQDLLAKSGVVRCYLIGTDGIQIGQTLVSGTCTPHCDDRFKPLEDARSADWFRRHYLRRAIFHPEQLQVTRPYLSITGAHMCITLSMMFGSRSGEAVLCCDLKT